LLARRYRGRLDDNADEFIAFAVDGATRMQGLINDLLAYSRVSTQVPSPEPVDTAVLVDQVLADLRPLIDDAHADVTRGALPTVTAEPRRLAQVFQNLISNAVHYRGDEPPRIHVSGRREERMWRFMVSDNGIGIDPQHHERIFLLFQRLQSREHSAGTGLGLAICRKIVERHGGRIWVESTPGVGSTFSFTLPQSDVAALQ
jgi:light-regulated signal transduction histidine kinase (bacteriophytochrome)